MSGKSFAISLAAAGMALTLAGCGSAASDASSTLANILAFNTTKPPPPPEAPKQAETDEYCPTVDIMEGAAATRSYAGGESNNALRYQISIAELARQCTVNPGSAGYTLKVGVEARVLIGPAGGPGAYSAPLRIVVKRGDKVVANRQRTAGASVPAGQTGTTFTIVEEGIVVPPGDGDVRIEVGIGAGAGNQRRAQRPQRPQR
jgi:hypothetical protein